jgi:hypothetical protein
MRGNLGHRWTSGEHVDRVAEILDVEVPVGAEGGVDARVAKDALDAVSIDLRAEQQRGHGVATIVEAHLPGDRARPQLHAADVAAAER